MKILFLNNEGGGFAESIEVAPGTTAQKLFADKLSHRSPSDFLIRVNRMPISAEQALNEGDRVSFTPRKIDRAGVRAHRGALMRTLSRAV